MQCALIKNSNNTKHGSTKTQMQTVTNTDIKVQDDPYTLDHRPLYEDESFYRSKM